jgi:hypothetical protein
MMSNSDYIPSKESIFSPWVNNFFTYLLAHLTRFSIPAAIVTALQVFKDDWDRKYEIAETPSLRTKATVREKNLSRNTLKKQLRLFIKEYLAFNHAVTDADRDNMGLPVYKTTRTPVPIPTWIPEFWFDTSVLRRLIVHFRDNGKKSGAKPAGVHGAEIRWCILNHAPVSIDELVSSAFATHSPFTLEFDESDRGKAVYFCLRWENTKGEKGPWSEIMMAIIP